MAVAKRTKSKKAILFIDDDGRVYSTSTNFIMGLMNDKSKHDFVLLTRLPFDINDKRFKQSPLYDPDNKFNERTFEKELTNNTDGLSPQTVKKLEQKKTFKDKAVW